MRQVSSSKRLFAVVVLVILGAVIYSNALHGPFIFDDQLYIVDNSQIRDLRNFLSFSGTRYFSFLSFALNYRIGSLNPFGYHLFNITVHILNAIFVYLLVLFMLKALRQKLAGGAEAPDGIAFAAALIFISHPIETQAVTYITQRFASLTTLFYILSLLLYFKFRLRVSEAGANGKGARAWAFYALSFIFAAIAQKTKEISFTIPFMIGFFEFVFFKSAGNRRMRILYLAPFFLLLFIIPYTLFAPDMGFVKGGFDSAQFTKEIQLEDLEQLSRYSYFLTELRVIVTYLRLLFFPVNQFIDYDYPMFNSFLAPQVFLSFIFLSALFGSAMFYLARSVKRGDSSGVLISGGVIWFFVTLSIESSVIPIKDVIFEHRLYLPGIGVIISFSALLFRAFDAFSARRAVWGVIIVLVTAASVATFHRNRAWADEMTLWQDAVKVFPNKDRAYNNIAFALLGADRFDEAIRYSKIALNIRPEFSQPYSNIGYALANTGKPEEALAYFNEAVKRNPNNADAYNNMGNTLLMLGKLDEAIEKYQKTLSIDPGHANAGINLENAIIKRSRSRAGSQ